LSLPHAILLFFAGAVAGAMNAVAGGGSFIAFPTLLFTGVGAIPANATNTLALWVGTAASGGAYRHHLNISRRVMIPLLVTSAIGGLAGALLLIETPAQTFLRLIPWLMLAATLLFAFGRHLTGRISNGISHDASNNAIAGASFFELLAATYGGYFGGGIGIMNLAMLAAMGMTDIHAMNALKILIVMVINGVATVTFIATGSVVWPQALVLTLGAVIGGYFSAHFAQKLPQRWIRGLVIVIGLTMSAYFFVRAYR
jgi:uncharacterized membrane protein YfcA